MINRIKLEKRPERQNWSLNEQGEDSLKVLVDIKLLQWAQQALSLNEWTKIELLSDLGQLIDYF